MVKFWDKVKAFFKRSETILWARFQALVGAVTGLLVYVKDDPIVNQAIQTIMQPKLLPWYLIGIGLITELLRRRNDPNLGK